MGASTMKLQHLTVRFAPDRGEVEARVDVADHDLRAAAGDVVGGERVDLSHVPLQPGKRLEVAGSRRFVRRGAGRRRPGRHRPTGRTCQWQPRSRPRARLRSPPRTERWTNARSRRRCRGSWRRASHLRPSRRPPRSCWRPPGGTGRRTSSWCRLPVRPRRLTRRRRADSDQTRGDYCGAPAPMWCCHE